MTSWPTLNGQNDAERQPTQGSSAQSGVSIGRRTEGLSAGITASQPPR
jgi:hypothetical protein